jgi:hypothetical protein
MGYEVIDTGWILKESVVGLNNNIWIDNEHGFYIIIDKSYILDSKKDEYVLVKFKDIIDCVQIENPAFMGISIYSDYCHYIDDEQSCKILKQAHDLNFKEQQRLSFTKYILVKSIKIIEL